MASLHHRASKRQSRKMALIKFTQQISFILRNSLWISHTPDGSWFMRMWKIASLHRVLLIRTSQIPSKSTCCVKYLAEIRTIQFIHFKPNILQIFIYNVEAFLLLLLLSYADFVLAQQIGKIHRCTEHPYTYWLCQMKISIYIFKYYIYTSNVYHFIKYSPRSFKWWNEITK